MDKILVDWEHSMMDKINRNKETADFPTPENYNTSESEVKDYIYDKQRILDLDEERKKNLVIPGIILVMPVIILSYFGDGTVILLLGVGAGVVLSLLYFVVMRLVDNIRFKKMYNADIESYLDAVDSFVDEDRKG